MVRIDDEELLKLWDEHSNHLRGRLHRVAGPSAPVDDLLQDVFVKIYEKADKLQADFAARYLMKTTSNVARDYLRRKRCLHHPLEESLENPTPYDSCYANERRDLYVQHVQPRVAQLPEPNRQAIEALLRDQPRLRTALETGIPQTTLRSREQSALRRLRKELHYLREKPQKYHG